LQKRILAVHDISCIGKCSLTVALPILSAAGFEVSVLPTAVLSTHTGGFTGYTFRDLTSDIMPIIEHWKTLDIKMDSIYTGYLGSIEQISLMEVLFDTFGGKDKLIMVDPVMGDSGKLYPAFNTDFVCRMKNLCSRADIIIPNLTEAAFLLEKPYIPFGYDHSYIEKTLQELADLGPRHVVLSGVSFEKGKLGAASYDCETKQFDYYFAEEVEGFYHGTGDVFGSVLLAALMRGKNLQTSIKTAVDFTVESIRRTRSAGTDTRYGVEFETVLPLLISKLK